MSLRAALACCILLSHSVVVRAEATIVFAAVSLKEALGEVEKEYERATCDEVRFSFGASGRLAAQIKNGAPADLFISAADKQVNELYEAKAADEASRAVVAANQLVLIVPADAAKPVAGFSELPDARVKRIAIGQPRTVPAGEYALAALKKLGVLDAIRERLVYGANVRQVLDYVRRGEVEAGVVYVTDAMTEPKVKVVATADPSLHDPIVYPAVLIRRDGRISAGARRFLEYLQSEPAQAILRRRGFTPAPATGPTPAAPTTRPPAP